MHLKASHNTHITFLIIIFVTKTFPFSTLTFSINFSFNWRFAFLPKSHVMYQIFSFFFIFQIFVEHLLPPWLLQNPLSLLCICGFDKNYHVPLALFVNLTFHMTGYFWHVWPFFSIVIAAATPLRSSHDFSFSRTLVIVIYDMSSLSILIWKLEQRSNATSCISLSTTLL